MEDWMPNVLAMIALSFVCVCVGIWIGCRGWHSWRQDLLGHFREGAADP